MSDINKRISNNMIKLNQSKTQFTMLPSKQDVKESENLHDKIGPSYINAGIVDLILNSRLRMEKQVNSI